MDEGAGERTTGQRIRHFRERAGMSRPVLGGLVGRSGEWVKAVEGGKLLPPRLPLLIRLAEVLGVDDLAELAGEARMSASTWTKAGHEALPRVADALADYSILSPAIPALSAAELGAPAAARQPPAA